MNQPTERQHPAPDDDNVDTGGNQGTGMTPPAYDPRSESFNPPADWEDAAQWQGDYGRSNGGSATYAGSGDYGSEAGRYTSSPSELGDPAIAMAEAALDDPNATPGADGEDEPLVDSPEQTDEDTGAEPTPPLT